MQKKNMKNNTTILFASQFIGIEAPPSNLSQAHYTEPSVRRFVGHVFQTSPHEHDSYTRFQCLAWKCVPQCNEISINTQKKK